MLWEQRCTRETVVITLLSDYILPNDLPNENIGQYNLQLAFAEIHIRPSSVLIRSPPADHPPTTQMNHPVSKVGFNVTFWGTEA